MKMLALVIAEVCTQCSHHWMKMTPPDYFELFEHVRMCVLPHLDRYAAAKLLATHSVTVGKHAFHSALLHWVSLPDFDRPGPLCGPDCPESSSCGDTDHTTAAASPVAPSPDKKAGAEETINCGAARRRKIASRIAAQP